MVPPATTYCREALPPEPPACVAAAGTIRRTCLLNEGRRRPGSFTGCQPSIQRGLCSSSTGNAFRHSGHCRNASHAFTKRNELSLKGNHVVQVTERKPPPNQGFRADRHSTTFEHDLTGFDWNSTLSLALRQGGTGRDTASRNISRIAPLLVSRISSL